VPENFVLDFVAGVTPAKWVDVWKARMPRIAIDVRPRSQDDALQSLRNGEASVALVRLPFDAAGLSVIPLYSEVAVVVAAKDHPAAAFESLTLADLADENVLAGQDSATVELIAATDSVAIMPHSVARLHSRKDVVARPVSDAPQTQVALAWLESETKPWVEEFIGIVRGRTANSSRGAETPPAPKTRPAHDPQKRASRTPKPRRR
jgi:DNA-binding transcriptional LysR family regulator